MEPQPHETIWGLATAVVASRALHLVAELGVADRVGDDPVPVPKLAADLGVDAHALERVLLLLAAHSVFECQESGIAHSPASLLLRSYHPMSMTAFPEMMGMPSFTTSFANLGRAVRTGEPAFCGVDPEGLFAYLQRHPVEAQVFDRAMTAKAAADVAAVVSSYEFSRFSTVVDVGGGRGHLLRAILDSTPATTGVLVDLPEVTASFELDADRITLAPGDFFADSLPAADSYLLMEVIHDWADPEAVAILRAVRRAAPAQARVLIIENVIVNRGIDRRAHTLDIIMLAITGGRERTASELDELLIAAGFANTTVIDTPGPLRIVEAVAP
ncbi:MAG: methyltransferase [Candidatus Limnocylindrales bacterium]